MENNSLLQPSNIETKILTIRNQQVMIDRDLAELYGVETKRLNEQVKRNIERFPERFMFQLSDIEFESLSRKLRPQKQIHEEEDSICHMLLPNKVLQCYQQF